MGHNETDSNEYIGVHLIVFIIYLFSIARIFHGLNCWEQNGWYIIRGSAYFLLIFTLFGFISVGYRYHSKHNDCVHITHHAHD